MILLAVFLASLIGSPHCAGMCGGFVALYSTENVTNIRPHVAYNSGRLLSYMSVGAVAGLVGQSLDKAGLLFRMQHTAAALLAIVVFLWGIALWFGKPISSTHSGRAAAVVAKLYRSLFDRAAAIGPARLALGIGLLSALLPCGWLYLYVATAAGSASPVTGAAILFVFWLGTLPMMATVGQVATRVTGGARAVLPRVSAAFLIAAALFSFVQHLDLFHGLTGTHEHCSPAMSTR